MVRRPVCESWRISSILSGSGHRLGLRSAGRRADRLRRCGRNHPWRASRRTWKTRGQQQAGQGVGSQGYLAERRVATFPGGATKRGTTRAGRQSGPARSARPQGAWAGLRRASAGAGGRSRFDVVGRSGSSTKGPVIVRVDSRQRIAGAAIVLAAGRQRCLVEGIDSRRGWPHLKAHVARRRPRRARCRSRSPALPVAAEAGMVVVAALFSAHLPSPRRCRAGPEPAGKKCQGCRAKSARSGYRYGQAWEDLLSGSVLG